MGDIGRETLSQLAKSSAGLRQAGFQNAQQMAQADIGTNLQAQLANQQNRLQAGMANQQADLSGAGQRLGASNQLGQIANLKTIQ